MADMDTAGVIGRGLFIKGELHGEEDLIIEGRVEGEITLKKHLLIESTGIILADIQTENITIKGEMRGNMTATDKVEIHTSARVVGDITAPRVVIEDGAKFKGHIDMPEGAMPPPKKRER
ncbi:MAG: polymer-forming cytoskeletal protein [Deltaproteobacteria bacterium]|nr:polymer-forming cytoskeletal protein [Deltaproteobacteria bacterium]